MLPPRRPREFAFWRTPWQFGAAKLHVGSTSLTTDEAGEVVARVLYYPYGETRYEEGNLQTDYQYTGQRKDSYTQLIEMGARWYDAQIGRWISADTIIPDLANPQSLDRFAYVLGNPLRYVDPTGRMTEYNCADGYCRGRASGSSATTTVDEPPPPSPSIVDTQETTNSGWWMLPSSFGGYWTILTAGGDLIVGDGGSIGTAVVCNWRSGELSWTTEGSVYGRVGTPDVGTIGTSAGPLLGYGYSSNDALVGYSAGVGVEGQIDTVADFGAELGGDIELRRDPADGRLKPAYDLESRMIPFMLYGGPSLSADLVTNLADGSVNTNLSYTPSIVTVQVYPWKWLDGSTVFKEHVELDGVGSITVQWPPLD
jgi:RHS repeat-associated protein